MTSGLHHLVIPTGQFRPGAEVRISRDGVDVARTFCGSDGWAVALVTPAAGYEVRVARHAGGAVRRPKEADATFAMPRRDAQIGEPALKLTDGARTMLRMRVMTHEQRVAHEDELREAAVADDGDGDVFGVEGDE